MAVMETGQIIDLEAWRRTHRPTARPRRPREPEAPTEAVSDLWTVWRTRVRTRRALAHALEREPASVLADAGFTPESAYREVRKPFWRA